MSMLSQVNYRTKICHSPLAYMKSTDARDDADRFDLSAQHSNTHTHL